MTIGWRERYIKMNKLSELEWKDSQQNEAWFWKEQKKSGNLEQRQRNVYYRNVLEDNCEILRNFFDFNVLDDKVLVDVGSGPEGILHVLDGKRKIAIDPLMDEYKSLGYRITDNNVECICCDAESIAELDLTADVVFCLNALDHMQDPKLAL